MNENIRVIGEREHMKASERYVDAVLTYDEYGDWSISVPIEYRRTGLDLREKPQVEEHLDYVYAECHPSRWDSWRNAEQQYWDDEHSGASDTRQLFDILLTFKWTCLGCDYSDNPNPARRYQDIKEFGYTIASRPKVDCAACGKTRMQLLLLPLPRGLSSGYEIWTAQQRKRIVKVLDGYDVFEAVRSGKASLLPDHKFPEIRWEVGSVQPNVDDLSDEEIRQRFQLLSNQRNQQKREVCRNCYQEGQRGYPFGIKHYYAGGESWPAEIAVTGDDAEAGCEGCGWYCMETWRKSLNDSIATDEGPAHFAVE